VRLSLELTTLSYFHRWQPCLNSVSEKVADTFLKFGNVPQLSWCLYSPLLFITLFIVFFVVLPLIALALSLFRRHLRSAARGDVQVLVPLPMALADLLRVPQALEQPSNHTSTVDTRH